MFDSSVKKGRPFKTQIGVGQVIRGWDEGFVQLKKGQKATLICPPDYAYGAQGYPPVIPPAATLKFDVELLDFVPAVRASHILLKHTESRNPVVRKTGKAVSRTKAEACQQMEQLHAKVLQDPSCFGQLAQHFSECGSGANGGDLDYFGPGQMQQAFEEATYALQVNEISGLVSTDSGIHIIMRTA